MYMNKLLFCAYDYLLFYFFFIIRCELPSPWLFPSYKKFTMGVTSASRSILRVKRRRGITEVMNAKGKFTKGLKCVLSAENYELVPADKPTYVSIEAGPSMKPPKKYCDITGFPAKYTDPKSSLRFCSKDAYKVVRALPEHRVQELLGMRGAQSRIK